MKKQDMEDQENHTKVPICENLVDRLLRNIKRRTATDMTKANGRTDYKSKPMIMIKIGNTPIISERDFASEHQTHTESTQAKVTARSSFGFDNYKKGRFLEYHRHVADTKDERMLKVYDQYRKVWSKQMKQSIKARDKLDGKVNHEQQDCDQTITEKMDDKYCTKNEIKKVMSKSFEQYSDQSIRNSWISSLRTRTEGTGADMRNICCEKMEETISSAKLSHNKRTYLRNSSRKRVETQMKDNNKVAQPLPGRDFITECSQPEKAHLRHIFTFPQSQTAKAGTVNHLPSKSDVPLCEVQKNPIAEKILVKPLLTATKRPQTSNRYSSMA